MPGMRFWRVCSRARCRPATIQRPGALGMVAHICAATWDKEATQARSKAGPWEWPGTPRTAGSAGGRGFAWNGTASDSCPDESASQNMQCRGVHGAVTLQSPYVRDAGAHPVEARLAGDINHRCFFPHRAARGQGPIREAMRLGFLAFHRRLPSSTCPQSHTGEQPVPPACVRLIQPSGALPSD